MHPARLRAEALADRLQERVRVVVDLDLVAVDVGRHEAGVRGDLLGVLAGHDALVGPGLHDRDLDIEPAAPLGVVGPERRHLGALVAGDHRLMYSSRLGEKMSSATESSSAVTSWGTSEGMIQESPAEISRFSSPSSKSTRPLTR